MKYYNLTGKNTLVVEVENDTTGKFSAKNPVSKMVDAYKETYGESYLFDDLKAAFPEIKEIKRVPYAKSVDNISAYNSDQDRVNQELDGLSIETLNNYIFMFPAKNPKMLSYQDLNKIRYMMFIASREIDQTLSEPSPETLLSITKGLYALLKDAKDKNNKKYINAILRAGKDLNPADYGFTAVNNTEEGDNRGQEPTRRPDRSDERVS